MQSIVSYYLFFRDKANNVSGGLGLTGGLADVDSLYDVLMGIHLGLADDSLLDRYDEVRRSMWHDHINVISSGNLKRLNGQDPEKALESDQFLQKLLESANDRKLAAQMQLVSGLESLSLGILMSGLGRRCDSARLHQRIQHGCDSFGFMTFG